MAGIGRGLTRLNSDCPYFFALASLFLASAPACEVGPAEKYATVRLTADLSQLTQKERRMIPLLIEAAEEMDEIFRDQAFPDRKRFDESKLSAEKRRFLAINYGPWDRLQDNEPFVEGLGAKPPGAGFYPPDITKAEFEKHVAAHAGDAESFRSLYTLIRRDEKGGLVAVPYSTAYRERLEVAAGKLREAATLAEDPGLRRYLDLRAAALLSDEYRPSDLAWMDMKSNRLDVVIGPIETYEDRLFGYKAAFEAYVLLKDKEWSRRLEKYAALLPGLQRGLPVPDRYKKESPGAGSDLNAYDVIYYAGDCNAGSKTIAINLPNDEEVQLEKGTRRLQLKNAIRAKFDRILAPIARELIAEEQQKHVTFDAFFGNIMFHEVAHGLGIKKTLDGKGTVREALKEESSALEEGKADILGLYMIEELLRRGDLTEGSLTDHHVTFLAGIFRSVRFGAASAHGRANMVRFNFFERMGAFERDADTGRYRVDPEKMSAAVKALSRRILTIQGDGDYQAAKDLTRELGNVPEQLQGDLDHLSRAGIPVDIVFEQGLDVLGLADAK